MAHLQEDEIPLIPTAVTTWFIYLGHIQFTGAFCQELQYRLTEAFLICLSQGCSHISSEQA